MTCKESIEWLKSLKKQSQYLGLWHYEQTLTEIIELLQSDRLVELPCRVWDKVYYISIKRYIPLTHTIVEAEVLDYNINGYGICDIKIRPLNSEYAFTMSDDKIYFTKSEAEAKLKELNNETTKA